MQAFTFIGTLYEIYLQNIIAAIVPPHAII